MPAGFDTPVAIATTPRFVPTQPIAWPRRTARVTLNPPAAPLPLFHAWRA